MKLNKLLCITPLLLLTGLAAAYLISTINPGDLTISSTNTQAPSIVFTTITGEKIELAKLQGNPVIVTFWASDCANCIKEMSHLINLYNQFHDKGLKIIAIAMYYDPPNHVVTMTKAKQLPYSVVLDLKARHAKAFGQVELIPATFLISPKGKIVMHITGLFDIAIMRQQIEKFLQG